MQSFAKVEQLQTQIISKSMISLIVSFSSIILLFLGIGLGDLDISFAGFNFSIFIRVILSLVGPMLTFLFYLGLLFYLIPDFLYTRNRQLIIRYILTSSIVSLIFAITLNSRAFLILLISTLSLGIPFDSSIFLIMVVIGPLIEELSKIIPVFFIARGLISLKGEAKEVRILENGKIIVSLGILLGLIFNLLETYWYTFNVSYLFILDDSTIWNNLRLQLIVRTINPVHFLATGIAALGISVIHYSTNQRQLSISDFRVGLGFFGISVFIHGLWNASVILDQESTPSLTFWGVELYVVSWLFILLSQIGLFVLIKFVSYQTTEVCQTCYLWHNLTIKDHRPSVSFNIPLGTKFKSSISRNLITTKCLSCKNPIKGGLDQCEYCNAKLIFACNNCNAPIPVYESECWRCKRSVIPVFDNILSFSNKTSDRIIEGIVYLLTVLYIGSVLSILVIIVTSVQSIALDFSGIQIIFLGLLGSAMVITSKWLMTPDRKSLGMSIGRVILAMVIFNFSFLLLGLAFLFYAVSFFITTFFFILEWLIFILLGLKLLDFQPLFHSEDYE